MERLGAYVQVKETLVGVPPDPGVSEARRGGMQAVQLGRSEIDRPSQRVSGARVVWTKAAQDFERGASERIGHRLQAGDQRRVWKGTSRPAFLRALAGGVCVLAGSQESGQPAACVWAHRPVTTQERASDVFGSTADPAPEMHVAGAFVGRGRGNGDGSGRSGPSP